MMTVGQRYRDEMDEQRTVVPSDEQGTCRVYFDGRYVGNAHVPPRLFSDLPSRVGFTLDSLANAEARRQEREPKRWERDREPRR